MAGSEKRKMEIDLTREKEQTEFRELFLPPFSKESLSKFLFNKQEGCRDTVDERMKVSRRGKKGVKGINVCLNASFESGRCLERGNAQKKSWRVSERSLQCSLLDIVFAPFSLG